MAFEVRMPQVTQTMLEAKVVGWFKKEGEEVEKGQPLVEIETDKTVVELEAEISGVLLQIVAREGEVVKVGGLLAVVGKPEEKASLTESKAQVFTSSPVVSSTERVEAADQVSPGLTDRKPVSPAARRKVAELNINISNITGTGPDGLVTTKDVAKFMESQSPEIDQRRPEYREEEIVPLEGIKKAMFDRVTMSHSIAAQTTTFAEVDVTSLLAMHQRMKIPLTPFVAKAAIVALQEFPLINSSLIGNNIVVKKYVNLGVATTTERGLVVPVIHNVEAKTVREIAQKLKELAEKARIGKLSLSEASAGTFTVTNSGVFGSLFFTPLINYPESAILGMGKVMKSPVVIEEQITIRSMMYVSLSYDHRVIDGATAVNFLQRVKQRLETLPPDLSDE
ncbi:MAG: hypothetical protein CL874_06035 [Dehalococcoidales bacterium]|nr:hypothetical protein [Dehalococcoidales bacterium]